MEINFILEPPPHYVTRLNHLRNKLNKRTEKKNGGESKGKHINEVSIKFKN